MKFPEWIKPALWGAGVGAIALAFAGFTWGGWQSSGDAAEMASKKSMDDVAQVLLPYCVQDSKAALESEEVLAEYKKGNAYQRRQIIEKAGWATPLGADKPNSALASVCQVEISKDI